MKVGKSTDGGQTWSDIHNVNELIVATEFYDENRGLAGGSDLTFDMTTDGGTTWSTKTMSGGSGDILSAGYFDKDTIWIGGFPGIYKTTDGGATWNTDTTMPGVAFRAAFVTPTNIIYMAGDLMATTEPQIWRKIGPAPLIPEFEAGDTLICSGTTVDFTDYSFGNITSWYWTFEGGTPAVSTNQNPSVIYNTPGEYYVKLRISDGSDSASIIKMNYISVLETPAQADTPEGDETVCTGMFYTYSIPEVPYAEEYDWELSPADAGTLEPDGNEASLQVADNWTGDFTLRVRAGNMCGTGDWSGYLEGTVNESPEEFTLEGGGSFCEGGDGVEITLDGSQTGVVYELFVDGDSTGITVDGTGSQISFGLVSVQGYYTATGSNATCTSAMMDQVYVEVLSLPAQPAMPTGPGTVCNSDTTGYSSTGGDDADSYTWILSPSEAGTLTTDSLDVTVEWDSNFSGAAYLSLFGMNDCGDGNTSEALEITVEGPNPEIAGEDAVCDYSDEVYQVTENDGSTYAWNVTGGTITEGQGTYMITVAWAGEGSGTLNVEEETETGCTGSSAEFEVTIDSCTGITETGKHATIKVFPNPATRTLNIQFIDPPELKTGLKIINQQGQVMYNKDIISAGNDFSQSIDISHLPKGIYFLYIKSGNSPGTHHRFVKQ